jgi:hypothetical protein
VHHLDGRNSVMSNLTTDPTLTAIPTSPSVVKFA